METFSALLAICEGNSPITGEFPAQRPVTRGFNVSLICAWTNGWVNNRDAGDLRRHRAHYDVTVMWIRVLVYVALDWVHRWSRSKIITSTNADFLPTGPFSAPLKQISYKTVHLKCCLQDVSHFVEVSMSWPQWRVCWPILSMFGFQRSLETFVMMPTLPSLVAPAVVTREVLLHVKTWTCACDIRFRSTNRYTSRSRTLERFCYTSRRERRQTGASIPANDTTPVH